MKSQFANDIKLVKERCELFATHRGKSVRMKLESCEGKTVDYTTFADDDINGATVTVGVCVETAEQFRSTMDGSGDVVRCFADKHET